MTKHALTVKLVLSRTHFLILFLLALLLMPAVVFAEGDAVPEAGDSSTQSEIESYGETSTAGGFDSPVDADQNDTFNIDNPEPSTTETDCSPAASDPGDTFDTDSPETTFLEETPPLDSDTTSSEDSIAPNLDREQNSAGQNSSGNSYIAEVTSDLIVATGKDETAFTMQFTEVGHHTPLGSVELTLPENFSNMDLVDGSITTPEDKNWFGSVVDLVLKLWAADESSYLGYGETVSVTFTATTPETPTGYTFATKAWTDNSAGDCIDGFGNVTNRNNMAEGHSDPLVWILHKNSPTQISTAAMLNGAVRADLAGNFIQTAHIDLSSYSNWEPIGTTGNSFTGSYDGNGYTISNLTINRPDEDNIGLFGHISGGATLNNISLLDVTVTGKAKVGGLVGLNYMGTITDCYATGSVTGNEQVGGLVGSDLGNMTNSYATGNVVGNNTVGGLVGHVGMGAITTCYATGSVTGTGTNVGGLVGLNYGIVTNSYATGLVTGSGNNAMVGGLVGHNSHGTISNSYATGAVNGTGTGAMVGGLVGRNTLETGTGTVSNSYATGLVTGTGAGAMVGGLVGHKLSGTITNSYWNTDSFAGSGIGSGSEDDDSVEGKSTGELQTISFHQNTLEWNIAGVDGSYPVLGWQVNWTNNIWYMGTPPSNNSGGNSEPVSVDGGSNIFSFPVPLPTLPAGNLTNIPGPTANAIITPAFVTGGSATDLVKAIAAYNQAKQSYEANYGSMNAAEIAVAEVELAIANAAIMALEFKLAADNGQAIDLAALVAAYNAAREMLNNYRGLLTADQFAAAEALLKAITAVIVKFRT